MDNESGTFYYSMNLCITTITSTSYLGEVLRLYRQAKRTLGHMPRSGFEEGIARGTANGAFVDDGRLVGYVLYRI